VPRDYAARTGEQELIDLLPIVVFR
jgi:hypothetical protein